VKRDWQDTRGILRFYGEREEARFRRDGKIGNGKKVEFLRE